MQPTEGLRPLLTGHTGSAASPQPRVRKAVLLGSQSNLNTKARAAPKSSRSVSVKIETNPLPAERLLGIRPRAPRGLQTPV